MHQMKGGGHNPYCLWMLLHTVPTHDPYSWPGVTALTHTPMHGPTQPYWAVCYLLFMANRLHEY